jgi:hypothetical protein
METFMRKLILPLLLIVSTTLAACSPQTATPAETAEIPLPTLTTATATPEATSATDQLYSNADFGLSFTFPKDWYGPDEYVSGDSLRVAVGSDVVYPYGTDLAEQKPTRSNTYQIVLQFDRSDSNEAWPNTFDRLASLQDGQEISDIRSKLIRVRALSLGNYQGYEYIATLADTASTEPVYSRVILLRDDQGHLLNLMGSPNNVEIPRGQGWKELFTQIDAENQPLFAALYESLQLP